jgi:hypothetical protein
MLLGVELHFDEGFFLSLTPSCQRQLVLPRAGVEAQ